MSNQIEAGAKLLGSIGVALLSLILAYAIGAGIEHYYGKGAMIFFGPIIWLLSFLFYGFLENTRTVAVLMWTPRAVLMLISCISSTINFPPGTGPLKTLAWAFLVALLFFSTIKVVRKIRELVANSATPRVPKAVYYG